MSDLAREAKSLFDALDKGKETVVPEKDPVLTLRSDIVGFLKGRIDLVAEVENVRKELRHSMQEDIVTMTYEQKERLYTLLGSDARSTADSILNIFKAAPGAPSPLGEIMRERNLTEDEAASRASKLTGQQLQNIEQLMMVLAGAAEHLSNPTLPQPQIEETDPWADEPEADQS